MCVLCFAWSLQSRLTLCDPMDCSPPGFSVQGIFQARVPSGLTFSPPGDLPGPGVEPTSLALAEGFFTTSAAWEVLYTLALCIK